LADVRASGAYRHRRAPRPRRQPGWIATVALLLAEAFVAIVLVIAGIGMFARVRVAWQTPVDLRAAVPLIDQQLRERPAPRQVYGPPVERPVAQPPSIDRDGETDMRPIAPAPAAAPERAVNSEAEPRSPERPTSVSAEPGADAAAPADTIGGVAASRSAEDRTKSDDPPATMATTVAPVAAAAAIAPAAVEPAEAAASVASAARTEPPPPVASASVAEPPKPEAVAPAESTIVSQARGPDTSPPVPAPSAEAPSAGAAETQRAEPVTATATAEPGTPVAAETRAAERPAAQAEKPDTTGSIDRVPTAESSNAGDAAAAKRDPSTAGAVAAIGEPARPRTVARSRPHHRAARHARLHRAPAPPAQPATTQTTYGFYPFKSSDPQSVGRMSDDVRERRRSPPGNQPE
jgi:hypothetical protein